MIEDLKLNAYLKELQISYEYYSHPPAPTIEIAKHYWSKFEATHCKNIFLRNHKGNQHYLVLLPCDFDVNIKLLELKLKQGKLSFASATRLLKYLNLLPGSVTPFGLINDNEHHVIVYVDKSLLEATRLSFHPNYNTASVVIEREDFLSFLKSTKNKVEFLDIAREVG